jgi:ribosome-associated toxin RatA of RatAB toxin-antitoxin module
MIKKILLGLLILVVGIIIVSRFQPDTYTVERTGLIAAPPSAVFAQINDFHNWEKFNPWDDLDSNMVHTYDGPQSGVGAKFHWSGENAGEGNMTIVESMPDDHLKVDMEFIEPFAGKAVTAFKLVPDGEATKLTWSMTGENNFFSKIMSLFMSMDKMIGSQYEKGFARMNSYAASMAKPATPVIPMPMDTTATDTAH